MLTAKTFTGNQLSNLTTAPRPSLILKDADNSPGRVEDAEALECLTQMDKGYTYPVDYFYGDECELGFFEV